ncbi:LacI family DNA-binding transcriptional regulator [Phytohabitans rumicis]|uniref:LacI family transcriptional regulator n=1 Tax=Phytohabitans rumicis TaxID=1076125 RepID=A0A6V8LFI8_9ACTN|nr:LacI family DNA-binding transcriptional regulator [Phytohabitans rumicis]GFJ93601.1 LacI family transcriptional regulator [Phytohabitans rumicis]
MNTSGPDAPDAGRRRAGLTVARIAHLAGVSAPTVSKVLNGRAGVASDTRQRIEQVIQDHGYRRQEQTEPATPVVEVVFQSLDSLWALEIIRGVEQVVRPHGLAVAVSEMHGQLTPDQAWTQDVLARRPTGVIAVSANLTEMQSAQLASRAIPLVILDPSGEPTHETPSVGATNWNGGLVAARHLLELGHRRIAMINGSAEFLCCRARLDGFRAAVETAGVPVDPDLIRVAPLYVEGGHAEATALLALPEPPTAIFAANDLQALGVYEAARARGMRIPQELSVVGFDDLPFARWAGPALTTVRQPLFKMGATAAELALALADGRKPEHDRIELATTLVVRDSTAPPPDPRPAAARRRR